MDYLNASLEKDVIQGLSSLALAHVGDAVFDLMVRTYLCSAGRQTSGNLHRETVRRVSAPAQATAAGRIMHLLDDEEEAVFRRGRNARVHYIPKNASRGEYQHATGLECLLGYLYLRGRHQRINELFVKMIVEGGLE